MISVFLGVIVQPKLKRPVFVFELEAGDNTVGIFDFVGGDLVQVGSGYLEGSGRGDYAWAAEVTGYPRSHTPSGVREKGKGYGTCLYTGLVLLASAEADGSIEIDVEGSGHGISSESESRTWEASNWWSAARRLGLVVQETHEKEGGEEEEEEESGVDLLRHTTSRQDDQILEAIREIVEYVDDGYVTSIDSLKVSIARTVGGVQDVKVDVYTLKSAARANLVGFRSVVSGGIEEWLAMDPDDLDISDAEREVLVAFDYSQGPSSVTDKMLKIAKNVGATDREIKNAQIVARYGRMADIGRDDDEFEMPMPRRPESLRRAIERLPRSERRDVERAAREIEERREELGWNALADLP